MTKRVMSFMVQLKNYLKIGVILLLILLVAILLDNRVSISSQNLTLIKQSRFRQEFRVYYTNPIKRSFNPKFTYEVLEEADGVSVIAGNDSITVKGKTEDDFFKLKILSNNRSFIRVINFNFNNDDSDGDGFPDLVELYSQEDRDSFVNWFTSIGKSQFYNISENWDEIHQDCAGLVTYSYREALKSHDLNWLKNYSDLNEQRDIERYNYPNIPILGINCFNSSFGFQPGANASTLLNYNMQYISKNIKDLKKGDVLFYYDENYEMPYHSMIYLGEPGYVVYHTGPIDDENRGEVRMVLVEDLLKHPDEKWHPKENNKKYLGGFRWRILM